MSEPEVRLYAGTEMVGVIYPSHKAQTWMSVEKIPREVIDAVLTAEDRRFWTHPGIDPVAVARAFHVNLKQNEVRQGGSTITQQVARTVFLDTRRTWTRKLSESAIALMLEARYSKKRILETYLNTVYLGQAGDVPVHGLPAAAQHFLGKDLGAVEVEEAAWLAGAIRAPNRLLSGTRPEARQRRDEILVAMRDNHLLPAEAARRALARPLPRPAPEAGRIAPYFVDFVAAEFGRRAAFPVSGETRVQTSLDPALQRAAETAVRQGIARIEKARPQLAGRVQAAALAIDPSSGEIRAMVGGRRYGESPFNRATRAARQPGSIFKPFVYLAAFEAERRGTGLTPASLLADEPLSVRAGGDNWEPRNMDGQFHGPVTVRRALEQSLNIPAVRVTMDLGARRVAEVAHAVGIEHPLTPVPSLALGTSEVTLLEISSAFATLANGGIRMVPTGLAAGDPVGPPLQPLPGFVPRRIGRVGVHDHAPAPGRDAPRDGRGQLRLGSPGRDGGENRNHRWAARRLVRRVHAGPGGGSVGGSGRRHVARAHRFAGRVADLGTDHAGRDPSSGAGGLHPAARRGPRTGRSRHGPPRLVLVRQ